LKSNLIEGAATLYVIDEDKSKHAMQLARSLSSVPELVKSQLEELRKHLAVEARVSTPSIWSLVLLPIFDHSSVLKEMELISQIMHALADSTLNKVSNGFIYFVLCERVSHSFFFTMQTKLEDIREMATLVKSFDMKNSSRDAMHLVPYQRLIWLLEGIEGLSLYLTITMRSIISYTKCASTSESNIEKTRPYIASLLRDISSNWHSRLWRNSYLHDGVFNLTNNEKGSKVSNGFHLWSSSASLDHNANFIIQIPNVTPGSSALYQAVETLACLNIS
jgi:hypothetical protein